MKLPVLALIGVLAGCGRGPVNTMLGTAVRRTALRPPHEAIYVQTFRGIARVWLDTAEAELVAPTAALAGRPGGRVFAVDERTSISIHKGRYFVRKPDGLHEVPDIVESGRPEVSPDGTRFAVTQSPSGPLLEGRDEIVVVAIADLGVRRFPLPNPTYWLRWSADSREVHYGHGLQEFRLELATGQSSRVERTTTRPGRSEQPGPPPGGETCATRGMRLELDRRGSRQRIVLVPISIPGDPDRLRAIEPRVLVEATDHDWSPHSGHEFPSRLGDAFFTASCNHFVFTLRDIVYLGETRTGRFARVIAGSDPSRDLRPE